jgi:hypothetical protein
MDIQELLNDAGDICDDVLNRPAPIVPGPANLLKITSDEIHLGLLHSEIKSSAEVPFNPSYNAIARAEPRPFQLCLPAGFKASALAFFKLFFTPGVYDVVVRNTNLYADQKDARTARKGKGRR